MAPMHNVKITRISIKKNINTKGCKNGNWYIYTIVGGVVLACCQLGIMFYGTLVQRKIKEEQDSKEKEPQKRRGEG